MKKIMKFNRPLFGDHTKSTWGLTGVEFHGNFGDIRFIDDFRKEEFDDCLRTSDELE